MTNTIKSKITNIIGQSLNKYNATLQPKLEQLKFKEAYQGRIIDCMVGEIDDNYIETPETDSSIVKLEYSKEGVVKIPNIKGKTILVDVEGIPTDTPAEGCRLISVGEAEDNKVIILSKNKNVLGDLAHGSINTGGMPNLNFTGKYRVRTDFIKLKDLENYALSTDNYLNKHIIFYYSSHNYESFNRQTSWEVIGSPTMLYRNTEDRYAIIEFSTNNDNSAILDIMKCKVQLESNNQTPYIEPKSHKTEILLNEPLKKGDYIENNKLFTSTERVIFDGTKKWVLEKHQNIVNCTVAYLTKLNSNDVLARAKSGVAYNNNKGIINNQNINYVYSANDYPHFYIENGLIRVYLPIELGISTNDDINDYFKNNNFIIEFETKEPITTELPNSIATQGYDDTTMYIENSITPTITYGYNATIPYKKELVKQKEEVDSNTLDIENNIIPFLMDIEFNLMTMEDK